MAYASYDMAIRIAARGVFPDDTNSYSWLVLAVVAAILISFGIGQALALFWIGVDADQDLRLWAVSSSKDRGLIRIKRDSAARTTVVVALSLSLLLLVSLEALLFRPMQAGLASLRWEPSLALLLVASASWLLVMFVRRHRDIPKFGRERSKAWVSQNTWSIQASGTTLGAAIFFSLLGITCLVPALHELVTHPITWPRLIYLIPGIIFLAIPCSSFREISQNVRHGPAMLNLVRKIENGQFRLSGTIATPKKSSASRPKWRGVIEVSDEDGNGIRGLTLKFPVALLDGLEKNMQTLAFDLAVKPPATLPYNAGGASWTLTVFDSSTPQQKVAFLLPLDVMFAEEMPLT